MKIYEVGGAVRDSLLGVEIKERDWVVIGSNAKELINLGYKKIGKDFPVFLHPKTKEEYSLARKEKKIASGYHGFSFDTSSTISLEDDLLRRDLTINAIARDNNKIVDPFNWVSDLKKKLLRHVSPAFKEDPLRVIRVARFAAKFNKQGFKIAQETLELMTEMCMNGEIDTLRPERIWLETEKALATDRPDVFFTTLKECNALKIIFPEIDALFGVPQSKKSHPEIDTGIHIMMCLKIVAEMTNDKKIRFATLTHDLGKSLTDKNILPKHTGHEENSVHILNNFFKKFPVPNDYKDISLDVARFHGAVHKINELNAEEIMQLIEGIDGIRKPSKVSSLLIACEADHKGRKGMGKSYYKQKDFFENIIKIIKEVKIEKISSDKKGKDIGISIRKKRKGLIEEFLYKENKNNTG